MDDQDQVPEGYTPFTTSATEPDGQTRTVTGYGPRRPITPPPSVGGVGPPDLGPGISQAFRNLPVDQAIKAVEMAVRFQGQRGYMRDLQGGMNAAQAFAKWGPMLFHSNATGIPEAIDRSVPPQITPYQKAQLDLRNQQMQSATEKAKQSTLHFGPRGEIIRTLPNGQFEVARKPIAAPDQTTTERYDVPEVPASPAIPAKPASPGYLGGYLFGAGAHPEIPAVPAVAGVPLKHITKTRKIGVDQPTADNEPAAEPSTDSDVEPSEPSAPNPAATSVAPVAANTVADSKVLTKELAVGFLRLAKGNKDQARKLAKDAGYKW